MTPDRRQKPLRAATFAVFVFAASLGVSSASALAAQPHEAAPAAGEHAVEAEGPHEQTTLQTVAKLANFALLAGALVYFLKSPITAHLKSRAAHIRQDLVTAAEMRAAATAQLAEIDRKLKGLPFELDALRARGARDLEAEQARIAAAADVERSRLLEHTRHEIATRLRVARRELTAHAAQLAVNVAEARIRQTITPEDQLRLVDRFTTQLEEAR